MLTYPAIDPVVISLGPLTIHWYGLMYLVGFLVGWWLGRLRAARPDSGWRVEEVDELLFYIALGVVLGGRFGYVLFYSLPAFFADPLMLFRIWEGGMSFHGGLLGVLFAMWLFGRRFGHSFFESTDFIAPLIPVGLGAGRLGNFINGELWGKPGEVAWAMQVPCLRFPDACVGVSQGAEFSLPLHPNQLYEAGLEGVVLFLLLWIYSAKPRPTMAVSGMFLLGYGLFRFLVELVRVPDAHLGYIAFDWLTMGQILTLPMLAGGPFLLWLAYRREA